ncbi:GntR family transcriptional regulator [Streptomyces sp. NPDC096033]|uniref:GntR family transcriptional regulator n=1 Tax=Streptomyces sp. NPDC096033 TaxID=3366071 RepID=UPI0037FDFC8D
MTSPLQALSTALYRYFDEAGHLLYVGISHDPDMREDQHRNRRWYSLAAERTVTWYPNRAAALKAETEAIGIERPEHNNLHNWETVAFPCKHWPSLRDLRSGKSLELTRLMRAEITEGRWLPGQKLPRQAALAEAVDLNVDAGIRATKALWKEGLLERPHGPVGFFVAA